MNIESIFLFISVVFLIFSTFFWVRPLTTLKLLKRKKELTWKFQEEYYKDDNWYKEKNKISAGYVNFFLREYSNISVCTLAGQIDSSVRRTLKEREVCQNSIRKLLLKIQYPITNFFYLQYSLIRVEGLFEGLFLIDNYLDSLFVEFDELGLVLKQVEEVEDEDEYDDFN